MRRVLPLFLAFALGGSVVWLMMPHNRPSSHPAQISARMTSPDGTRVFNYNLDVVDVEESGGVVTLRPHRPDFPLCEIAISDAAGHRTVIRSQPTGP